MNKIRTSKIKEKTVLFESYHGVSFTGNVYAIFLKMIESHPDMTFYIAIKDTNDPMIHWIQRKYHNKNITVVKYESHAYLKALATCQYLINDTSFLPYFIKRKNQIYANTWHGTPLKTLGLDVKNSLFNSHRNIQKNLFSADKLIMPNEFTAEKLIKSQNLDHILNAEVGILGNPRVDLTLNSHQNEILQKYALSFDKKHVLYAPTWRKSIEETTEEDIHNLVREVSSIQERMGDDYQVHLKAHYFISEKLKSLGLESLVIPNWVDTNELLSVIDTLITDYSSIFFDFLPLQRPIYFYMPDREVYEKTRGFYLDIEGLPGRRAYSLNELLTNIEMYQAQYHSAFKSEIDTYLKTFCPCDNGLASEKSVAFLLDTKNELKSFKSNKKLIAFYAGDFSEKPETHAFIELSKKIDYSKYDIVLLQHDSISNTCIENMRKLDSNIHIIFTNIYTHVFDNMSSNMLQKQSKLNSHKMLQTYYKLNFKRIFGQLNPDVLIDFDGTDLLFSALFAYASQQQKAIIIHRDLQREYEKMKKAMSHLHLLNHFHKVVFMSESIQQKNREYVSQFIADTDNKLVYLAPSKKGEHVLYHYDIIKEIFNL